MGFNLGFKGLTDYNMATYRTDKLSYVAITHWPNLDAVTSGSYSVNVCLHRDAVRNTQSSIETVFLGSLHLGIGICM